LILKQFDKALSIPRAELLRKKVKPAKKVSPLVLDYNPMPSKFRVASSRNQREENGGCSKCNKKCDLCKNYLIQASKFQSSATGRQYPIQQKLSCSSQNVIYLATCAQCNLQYVGSTSSEFKVRFRNHKSNMLKNKRTYELAIHFNNSEHEISQINFIIIELGLLKIPYILNNYYSLGRPIGPRNYLPLILMVLTNGGNLYQHRINYYN